jgi:hypothetical protein
MKKNQIKAGTGREELVQALRNLERKGLIVSRLDQKGELRWYATERGQRIEPCDVHISEELLN